MKVPDTTTSLLLVIAVALTAMAAKSYIEPPPVQAFDVRQYSWFFEPGVSTLLVPEKGEVVGKVAVDLQTGNVWGFPTGNGGPYPSGIGLTSGGLISHPVFLGRFALEEAKRDP